MQRLKKIYEHRRNGGQDMQKIVIETLSKLEEADITKSELQVAFLDALASKSTVFLLKNPPKSRPAKIAFALATE